MARFLQMKTGQYTGTGAAVNLSLGFKPKFFQVFNETDGTRAGQSIGGLAAGYSYDDNTSGSHLTDMSTQVANGITLDPQGVIVGTLYSTAAKVYRWVAIG